MKLGISVYPTEKNTKEIKKYIKKCAENNFTKVFMHILDINKNNLKEKLIQLKEISKFAQSNNMETLLDVDEGIYGIIKKTYDDLEFIKQLGISTIRFDTGFNGKKLAILSHNKLGIKIEINASGFLELENEMIENNPNYNQISASHNFYPQEYTGLSQTTWEIQSRKLKEMRFEVSSFVTLPKDSNSIGAWNINDGMVTLEKHRDLTLDLQVRELLATGLCDCAIISNMFATDEQIKHLGSLKLEKEYFEDLKTFDKINNNKILLNVILEEGITDIEKEILFFNKHIGRGDYSEYFLRSSLPRNVFKNKYIEVKEEKKEYFEVGDVLIGNNDFGKYKAEILIVTKRIKYDPRKNLIGKIPIKEHSLFKYISSWTHFQFLKRR